MNNRSLTDGEVQELREAYKGGEAITSLALRYHISRPTVYRVLEDDYVPRSSNVGFMRAKEDEIKRMNESLTEIRDTLKEILYVLKECDLHVRLEDGFDVGDC